MSVPHSSILFVLLLVSMIADRKSTLRQVWPWLWSEINHSGLCCLVKRLLGFQNKCESADRQQVWNWLEKCWQDYRAPWKCSIAEYLYYSERTIHHRTKEVKTSYTSLYADLLKSRIKEASGTEMLEMRFLVCFSREILEIVSSVE